MYLGAKIALYPRYNAALVRDNSIEHLEYLGNHRGGGTTEVAPSGKQEVQHTIAAMEKTSFGPVRMRASGMVGRPRLPWIRHHKSATLCNIGGGVVTRFPAMLPSLQGPVSHEPAIGMLSLL